MIRRTEAIVLNTLKYGETSLITTVYSREFGRKSLLVKGYRSTRGKRRHSYFQPMSIIDVVFYEKESRDLQMVSETSSVFLFHTLQTHPVRITLGLLTVEVFANAVQEEEQNIELYEFLRSILIKMDTSREGLLPLFLFYMVHLTLHLGFFPHDDTDPSPDAPVFFDLAHGELRSTPSFRSTDAVIREYIHADPEHLPRFALTRDQKNELMDTLFQYYKFHVEGFREPASLAVFREVFDQ